MSKMNSIEKRKVLVRSQEAGIFYGYITRKENTVAGVEVDLTDCRRIWYWEGAATLNQMAMEGVKKPECCKFSMAVDIITIIGVTEIIPCTDIAIQNLDSVEIWKL